MRCSSCGFESPGGMKFCCECSAPLALDYCQRLSMQKLGEVGMKLATVRKFPVSSLMIRENQPSASTVSMASPARLI